MSLSVEGFQSAFRYAEMFWQGLVCTLALSALTVLFGFIFALLLTLIRRSRFAPLRFVATAYVEIFRATPMMVQLFLVYYVLLAGLSLPSYKMFGFIRLERFVPGVLALSMNSAAYLSEIIRSGIQSIDIGQTEAARSLGMTSLQTMKEIILPQAIKESSICWTIGVQEIMSAVNSVKSATFSIGEPLVIAACLYFCLTFPTSKIIAHFERKMRRGDNR